VPEAGLTAAARAALDFAHVEATAMSHHHLGTEHILLGLIRDGSSGAARILLSQVDPDSVRALVRELVGVGSDAPEGELPLTPGAAQVLHFARREADMYSDEQVAPEHLLLGILREGEDTATRVLLRLGFDLGTIRTETSRCLSQG
jgi:ATP-dependent Clp protease ATP-binding subunit ClpC